MDEEYEFKPKVVTLEELYDIFMTDSYKTFRDCTSLTVLTNEPGERYVDYIPTIFTDDNWHNYYPLLYKHIVAEQFLRNPRKPDIENYLSVNCLDLFPLIDLWLHPLTWADSLKRDDLVVDGRLAIETQDNHRHIGIGSIVGDTKFSILTHFAYNPPFEYNGGTFRPLSAKPLHDWTAMTCNTSEIEYKIYSNERISLDDIGALKRYDSGTLFKNIYVISDRMGKKKAAELLQMLQEEWKTLRSMKLGTMNMSEAEINQFEYTLYYGFDDFKEEWKDVHLKKTSNSQVVAKRIPDFKKLIIHTNPENVLSILHRRIDGRKGKAIGIVLSAAAYKYKVLTRTPTKEEFNKEFPDIEKCSWRSISEWLKKVNKVEDLPKDVQDVILEF